MKKRTINIYMPFPDLAQSAACLDIFRLGAMLQDADDVLHCLSGASHRDLILDPAVKMWVGYEKILYYYAIMMAHEMRSRGYGDTWSVPCLHIALQMDWTPFIQYSHESFYAMQIKWHKMKYGPSWKKVFYGDQGPVDNLDDVFSCPQASGVQAIEEGMIVELMVSVNEMLIAMIKDDLKAEMTTLPYWWGSEKVHSSHRSALMRKNVEHYGKKLGWNEDLFAICIWPGSDNDESPEDEEPDPTPISLVENV